MSKEWAIADRRARKKAINALPPIDPRPPILSYTRLQHLQNTARAQYLFPYQPDPHLPDTIKESLEDEWWHIIDDTFKKIEGRFRCAKCGYLHGIEEVDSELDKIRVEMEGWDVEAIDGEMMEGWMERLEDVERGYWEAIVLDECGKEVEVQGSKGIDRTQGHGIKGVEVQGIQEVETLKFDGQEAVEGGDETSSTL